jgi:hypothetical protein
MGELIPFILGCPKMPFSVVFCHSRESGNPEIQANCIALDSREDGNDNPPQSPFGKLRAGLFERGNTMNGERNTYVIAS